MKIGMKIPWLFAPLLLLAAVPLLAGPPNAVTECGTIITEPGKYRLSNDLLDCPGDGVVIYSPNVKLDLKGHTISCADNGLLVGGVMAWGEPDELLQNVWITNGTVTGCSDGVLFAWVEDSKITKMTSRGNVLWQGSSGTGITLWLSRNNVIMHNHTYGNSSHGIGSWDSSGNLFKHNTSMNNGGGITGSGIDLSGEINSRFLCNRIHGNVDGILLAPSIDSETTSSGNLLRGNLVTNNVSGIGMMGFAWEGFYWLDMPNANTIRSNILEDNDWYNLFEIYYDLFNGDVLPHPDASCMNRWVKNQYESPVFGPDGCFGTPMNLDDDDVCALDDDSDSED